MLCVWFSSFKNVRHPICINKIKLIPKSGKLATFVKIIEYLPVHSFFLKRTGSIPEGSLQCSFDS